MHGVSGCRGFINRNLRPCVTATLLTLLALAIIGATGSNIDQGILQICKLGIYVGPSCFIVSLIFLKLIQSTETAAEITEDTLSAASTASDKSDRKQLGQPPSGDDLMPVYDGTPPRTSRAPLGQPPSTADMTMGMPLSPLSLQPTDSSSPKPPPSPSPMYSPAMGLPSLGIFPSGTQTPVAPATAPASLSETQPAPTGDPSLAASASETHSAPPVDPPPPVVHASTLQTPLLTANLTQPAATASPASETRSAPPIVPASTPPKPLLVVVDPTQPASPPPSMSMSESSSASSSSASAKASTPLPASKGTSTISYTYENDEIQDVIEQLMLRIPTWDANVEIYVQWGRNKKESPQNSRLLALVGRSLIKGSKKIATEGLLDHALKADRKPENLVPILKQIIIHASYFAPSSVKTDATAAGRQAFEEWVKGGDNPNKEIILQALRMFDDKRCVQTQTHIHRQGLDLLWQRKTISIN